MPPYDVTSAVIFSSFPAVWLEFSHSYVRQIIIYSSKYLHAFLTKEDEALISECMRLRGHVDDQTVHVNRANRRSLCAGLGIMLESF